MSRGKKVVFSGIALLGICSIFAYASPVSAQTVSSTAAAGVDNIAPDAVGSVSVEVDLGVPNVTISWTLPADDFSRAMQCNRWGPSRNCPGPARSRSYRRPWHAPLRMFLNHD